MIAGKELSALLQILRRAGVTHYQTPEITLDLAPSAPSAAPAPEAAGDGVPTETEEDDDIGDPRFMLERLNDDFASRREARAQAMAAGKKA